MKKELLAFLIASVPACAFAQAGDTGYEFLNIPVSAHSAALGGNNVSVVEDDITLMYTNPALLSNVSDKSLNFNYLSYISETNKLSASYAMHSGERGVWAVGAQLLNYGDMTETNADFEELGTFSAKDIAVQGGYSYLFSDRFSGGAMGKVLMSNYGDYSSVALAVDLGINYYDEEKGVSVGLAAQNLGGQVKSLHEETEKLPFRLVCGLTKEFENAPLRLSFTITDLTDWDGGTPLSIGADILPSSTTWIALGYDLRRAKQMKVLDDSHWAGFSIGGGLSIKKFKLGVAYGKYHVGASSLMFNATYCL